MSFTPTPAPLTERPKAAAIRASARGLFLKHGIRRVSVEEICGKAGVSKRTFYKYFPDREELAIVILDELIEESRARLEAILAADLPIEEKVRAIIAAKSQLAAETSAELYHEIVTADSKLGRHARQRQEEWDGRVRRFYREAQARGQIRRDLDVDLLMAVLIRLRSLVDDPELRQGADFGRLVETVMKLFFYGIVPRPDDARAPHPKRRRSS